MPPDQDGDGVLDSEDNCISVFNTNQDNFDGDALGDACDLDDDNDSVNDQNDAFPFDPSESIDTDNDGTGDNTDADDDNDNIIDTNDNCPKVKNPNQVDANGNGVGDVCEIENNLSSLCFPVKTKSNHVAIICL